MTVKVQMTGRIAGSRLTVLGEAGRSERGKVMWSMRCDCGSCIAVEGTKLRNGNTRSCGCLQRDTVGASRRIAGLDGNASDYPEYNVWSSMRRRCEAESDAAFKNYGARGVTVCETWRRSFKCFIEDMGRRPAGKYELDRINNERGYSPENCRWTTRLVQSNNKRTSVLVTVNGTTRTVAEWCRQLGLKPYTVYSRIKKYGWDLEQSLTNGKNVHRKNARNLTLDGEKKSMAAWARAAGLAPGTLGERLRRGWSLRDALSTSAGSTRQISERRRRLPAPSAA